MSHHAEQRVKQTHPESLSCDVEIHHYDQLDNHEQQWLHAVVHGEGCAAAPSGLDTGDVVVFTDYYQVK